MSRATRLLDLLQALRRRRTAVTAAALAAELRVSVRTVYRDLATLAGQGAVIDGAPGVGYLMHPNAFLPPLQFDRDEVEALVLGLGWVRARTDPALAAAAEEALAKIYAVLSNEGRIEMEGPGVVVGPGAEPPAATVPIALLRDAIRRQAKLSIVYADAGGARSERNIWPIALAFPEGVRLLVTWCEMRADFRTFRVDRIRGAEPTGQRYSKLRRVLLAEWKAWLEARSSVGMTADRN